MALTETQKKFNMYKRSWHGYEPELTEAIFKNIKEYITKAKWSPKRISNMTGIPIAKINEIAHELGYYSSDRRTKQFQLKDKGLRDLVD